VQKAKQVRHKQSSGRNFSLISVGNKNASPSEPKFSAFTYGTRWAPARRSRGSLRARPGGCCSASRKALAAFSITIGRCSSARTNWIILALIAPFSHPEVDALAALAARLCSHPFAAQWLQQNCDSERRPPSGAPRLPHQAGGESESGGRRQGIPAGA
jgi:hypothetical protein